MKCQLCNKQEATVQVKQVYDGVIRELSVCRDCAVEHGLDLESAVPWLSGLMLGTSQPKPYSSQNRTIPVARNVICT